MGQNNAFAVTMTNTVHSVLQYGYAPIIKQFFKARKIAWTRDLNVAIMLLVQQRAVNYLITFK